MSLSFNGAKFVKSLLNSLVIRSSMTSLVCLDFPEFIAVKMLRTLKPYFSGSCGKGLRRRTFPYFKQRFAATGKKDGFKA